MCNSIILENKLFDSQWDNKNHTLFENFLPTNNNYNYVNNNLIENTNNNNNINDNNDNNDNNEFFYNSNIPNESQLNKYSRFGFKPLSSSSSSSSPSSKSNSNKNENDVEMKNLLSFTIKSFLLLILYIIFFNYQLYSIIFIILLLLNFIITLISIKSIFKFKNLNNLNNIIYKTLN
ncbi:hypothetical protein ACTFIV_009755 [Dictyostelium citrinum]